MKTMKTISKDMIKELQVGDAVLVLTSTAHYWTGRIVSLSMTEIALDEAAWISQVGRHSDCVARGDLSGAEIEPHADGQITRLPRIGSVVVDWIHALPREQR